MNALKLWVLRGLFGWWGRCSTTARLRAGAFAARVIRRFAKSRTRIVRRNIDLCFPEATAEQREGWVQGHIRAVAQSGKPVNIKKGQFLAPHDMKHVIDKARDAAREKGLPLVNIAQPFKHSGLMLTCLKESGIAAPTDFADKTLGVWFYGNEYPFLSWMSQHPLWMSRFKSKYWPYFQIYSTNTTWLTS